MPKLLPRVLFAVSLALVLLTGCKKQRQPGQIHDISLPTYEGKTYTISPTDTQVTLLVFWATWCGPCVMEMPELVEFQKKFGPRGFRVVSVNTDDPTGEKAVPLAEKYGVNYPVLVGDIGTAQALGGLEALPTAFLIGRDGKLKQKIEGLYPSEYVEALIQEQL